MCRCIGVNRVADKILLRLAVGGVRASRVLELLLMASRPLSFRDIYIVFLFHFLENGAEIFNGERGKKKEQNRKQA